MTAKSSEWGAYIDAVLRIEAPDRVIWVRPTPISRSTGQYPDPEGRTICVITAHNPRGQLASDAENGSAQARLKAELERRGLTWWPTAGGDPSWTHVEASAAVIGMAEADAIALGAQFGQNAIFVLTPTDRQVVSCLERRLVATGWSIEPEADGNVGTSWPAVEVKKTAASHHEEPRELKTEDVQDEEEVKPTQTPPAEAVDKPGSLVGIVVLVDVDNDGEELYVIPESRARSELRSYATLNFARSYRDVLADDDAVQTVVDALGRFLEDLDEDLNGRELFAQRVAEDAPFDANEFFGPGGWRQWMPNHAQSSAGFVEGSAPVLWSRFKQPDGGWGIDYDPTDYLAAEDKEQILTELRVLGCEILHCPGLTSQYWGPDPDLVARIDAGEWPPRSGEPESPESGR
jgi:hypothetical protein